MKISWILSLSLLGLLAACSGHEVRENLGLNRKAPDEFTVVSRPPLSVPKEFYLTPPRPGEDSLFKQQAGNQARALVTGGREASLESLRSGTADTATPVVSSAPLASTGEAYLLRRAGTEAANPEIRRTIHEENRRFRQETPGVLGVLRGDDATEPVVNAGEEAERLLKNREGGKPVTEGEVPVMDPKEKSVLERVFD